MGQIPALFELFCPALLSLSQRVNREARNPFSVADRRKNLVEFVWVRLFSAA